MTLKKTIAGETAATGSTTIGGVNPLRPTTRSTPRDLRPQQEIALTPLDLALVERQTRLEVAVEDLQGNVDGVAAALREIMQQLPPPP